MTMVLIGFNDRLSRLIPLSFSKPSKAVDAISWSFVIYCRRPVFFRNLVTYYKYKHVAPFLRVFLFRDSHRENIFLPKHSMPFLRKMV